MTLKECYDKIRKLLNYYSAGGATLDRESDTWPRAAGLLDTAQKEFARMRPRVESRMITQKRLANLLPPMEPFLVGSSAVTITANGSKALTFSTDGPLTVTVNQIFRGSPMELASITCPEGGGATYSASYSGYAGGGDITITFSGGPAYVWDLAAYATYYRDVSDVPAYGAFRWQPLPTDCLRVDGLTLRPLVGAVMTDFRDYRIRGREIGLPWDFEGTGTLVYESAPTPIADDSPEDMELDVDDVSAEGMAYYAAAYLVAEENPALFELFMAVYRDMLITAWPDAEVRGQLNSLYYQRTRGLRR